MAGLIIRRLLQMIPLLIGITFLTFAIVNLVPGSPVAELQFDPRATPEDRERIENQLGLNEPWPKRYVIWVSHVARGDLGVSLDNYTSVRNRLLNVLPNTWLLSGSALILALLVSIPIGVYAAVKQNSLFDHFSTIGAVAFYAVPSFWLGLLLIILFGVKFKEWGLPSLPIQGMHNLRGDGGPADLFKHLILPVTALAVVQVASWTRYIRSSMLEVIRQDYIRTARAKGLKDQPVYYQHAFRNALIPLITLVGLSVPDLFAGAFLIETIFAWNGMGRLTVQAVSRSDYTLIMGSTLVFAVLTMFGNLLADILYSVFDPRIRYG
jgi:peptide/nickel transport system permease protein